MDPFSQLAQVNSTSVGKQAGAELCQAQGQFGLSVFDWYKFALFD